MRQSGLQAQCQLLKTIHCEFRRVYNGKPVCPIRKCRPCAPQADASHKLCTGQQHRSPWAAAWAGRLAAAARTARTAARSQWGTAGCRAHHPEGHPGSYSGRRKRPQAGAAGVPPEAQASAEVTIVVRACVVTGVWATVLKSQLARFGDKRYAHNVDQGAVRHMKTGQPDSSRTFDTSGRWQS